ncbi:hypothetical protein GQ600_3550 [Phytophthora cactorum]|nr:hypothetical protein GQ600_3550 [Phytophthora cactorum]
MGSVVVEVLVLEAVVSSSYDEVVPPEGVVVSVQDELVVGLIVEVAPLSDEDAAFASCRTRARSRSRSLTAVRRRGARSRGFSIDRQSGVSSCDLTAHRRSRAGHHRRNRLLLGVRTRSSRRRGFRLGRRAARNQLLRQSRAKLSSTRSTSVNNSRCHVGAGESLRAGLDGVKILTGRETLAVDEKSIKSPEKLLTVSDATNEYTVVSPLAPL